MAVPRLAIVVSHPIQYFSPWFKHLAAQPDLQVKVFYLWDFGVEARYDPAFGHSIQWDIPMLDGYEYAFVPNHSANPGTHHFRGLNNPGLVAALRTWSPNVILLFGYNYPSHLRVLLSWHLRNIPLLLRGDSHDLSRSPGWKTQLARYVRSLLFRRFDGFLAVGKANADYFRNCGVPDDRVFFTPHCVDNARFQAATSQAAKDAIAWRAELGIPADALVVLFAGKFEPKKRPQDLLNAFEKACNALPSADPSPVLLFVGSGVLEDQLGALAGDRLGRTVFFAPFQNQSHMPRVYATGDLLVLPSYGVGETWGLAVNEAMNLGRPTIVSSHVGCGPDLVVPGETGWIFEAGNINALAGDLVKALSTGRKGLALMGQEARTRVRGYSYEAATAGLRATLDRLLENAAGAAPDPKGHA